MIGFTREEIDAKLDDILNFADIGEFVNQPVKTYSSGMFVRLAFAVAINIEPEILIVDEALSVGDVFFQTKCYHKFEEFKKMGKTILFVSHDLGSVGKYCDRVVLLNKGKKLAEGNPKEMIDLYKRVMAEEKAAGTEQKEEGHLAQEGELWQNSMILNPEKQEYGDRKAQIVDFGIFDSKNKITNTVSKYEEFSLKMKVHFSEDVINPIFAMTIRDLKGTDLTGTNSMIEGEEFGLVEAGTDMIVTFKQSLPLQKGQYLLQLGLTGYNGDELEVHHRLYDICCIQVFSKKVTAGYFDMGAQFSWTKA
jgi:teichoic acid transport system ATP-binding protein